MNNEDAISHQTRGRRKRSRSPQVTGRRYEAVLRLSEALSQCREPEDLTAILSRELGEFLTFLQFYIVVYKENSDEVEWAVVGQEKSLVAAYANVPVQARPSWQAYKTQEPFYIRDWDTDERVPAQLKRGIADHGLDVGPLVFVPLTTPHRRIGALGMSGPIATVYSGEDINYWSLSAAAAIGIMLPIMGFMTLMQRYLVRGMTLGAVKG